MVAVEFGARAGSNRRHGVRKMRGGGYLDPWHLTNKLLC